MFTDQELVGKEICIEVDGDDGVVAVTGTLDSMQGSYWIIRGESGDPMLFNERYVRAVYLAPKTEVKE